MVLRKLEQDVAGFWKVMRVLAKDIAGKDDDDTTVAVASRLVGRWPST